jgi:NAD(P)-dependent dehydrogenase (short-subunit alcohol dehydrogenase family)
VKPGSIFFITGGGNGIGARAAELVVGEGHRVVVADIDESAASDCSSAWESGPLP